MEGAIEFLHAQPVLMLFVVLGLTFVSTLLLQLEFAIYLGIIASLILYLRRASSPRIATRAGRCRPRLRLAASEAVISSADTLPLAPASRPTGPAPRRASQLWLAPTKAPESRLAPAPMTAPTSSSIGSESKAVTIFSLGA